MMWFVGNESAFELQRSCQFRYQLDNNHHEKSDNDSPMIQDKKNNDEPRDSAISLKPTMVDITWDKLFDHGILSHYVLSQLIISIPWLPWHMWPRWWTSWLVHPVRTPNFWSGWWQALLTLFCYLGWWLWMHQFVDWKSLWAPNWLCSTSTKLFLAF